MSRKEESCRIIVVPNLTLFVLSWHMTRAKRITHTTQYHEFSSSGHQVCLAVCGVEYLGHFSTHSDSHANILTRPLIFQQGFFDTLKLKGGCAHFTMCILHFQLIDLDLWNVFCEVSPWGNFLFTLRGKTKYATLGMRLWCKYIRNYLLVYQLISHFLPYLQNYKEFEGEILDLQLQKYGLSFEIKKYTTSGWAWGDENVIGIRAFKLKKNEKSLN